MSANECALNQRIYTYVYHSVGHSAGWSWLLSLYFGMAFPFRSAKSFPVPPSDLTSGWQSATQPKHNLLLYNFIHKYIFFRFL